MRPTLTAAFRRELDLPVPEPPYVDAHEVSPRGWLVRSGITDVLEPFVVRLPQHDGDLAYYRGLTGNSAAEVLARLPEAELGDRQNDAPTLGRILTAAAAHPGVVEVHGYVVGPARWDERLTSDAFTVHAWPELRLTDGHDGDCQCEELLDRVRDELGIDDALCPPHEIRPDHARSATGSLPGWYLWWD